MLTLDTTKEPIRNHFSPLQHQGQQPGPLWDSVGRGSLPESHGGIVGFTFGVTLDLHWGSPGLRYPHLGGATSGSFSISLELLPARPRSGSIGNKFGNHLGVPLVLMGEPTWNYRRALGLRPSRPLDGHSGRHVRVASGGVTLGIPWGHTVGVAHGPFRLGVAFASHWAA
jgi:hypothetical protein